MKEHPILFSTPMVQAILAGRKTQTRRIIKPQPDEDIRPDKVPMYMEIEQHWNKWVITKPDGSTVMLKKYEIGDILWVRETWAKVSTYPEPDCFGKYLYKSMDDTPDKWKPSIFMPKDACRIFLKVVNIRVERLQDIQEEDAIKEGIEVGSTWMDVINKELRLSRNYLTNELKWMSAKLSFKTLWQKINGIESWNENPWVWVIKFERCEKPEQF